MGRHSDPAVAEMTLCVDLLCSVMSNIKVLKTTKMNVYIAVGVDIAVGI